MNKEELRKIVELYKSTENDVRKLDSEYGICLFHSSGSNFYNNYNSIIRKLFEGLFSSECVDLIENYIFDDTSLTFDELYNIIANEGKN